jgi:DNA-binding MarR family transcriptional regulator
MDRRKVDIYLTDLGHEVANNAAKDTETLMDQNINYLSKEEETQLNTLLDKLRGPHCSRDI